MTSRPAVPRSVSERAVPVIVQPARPVDRAQRRHPLLSAARSRAGDGGNLRVHGALSVNEFAHRIIPRWGRFGSSETAMFSASSSRGRSSATPSTPPDRGARGGVRRRRQGAGGRARGRRAELLRRRRRRVDARLGRARLRRERRRRERAPRDARGDRPLPGARRRPRPGPRARRRRRARRLRRHRRRRRARRCSPSPR